MDGRRARLEDERRRVLEQLRQWRGSSEIMGGRPLGLDTLADDAERAQASLRQHLEVIACERLVERRARLDGALQRLADGTYGRCERCGDRIGAKRLAALPEATTCVGCQSTAEGSTGRALTVESGRRLSKRPAESGARASIG